MNPLPTRDQLASTYLDQLPFPPYPVQEEALLTWFTAEQGLLVCAPTGTGKTLIAEAALFEALHTGKTAYYTTPLIALTEQKFREMQSAAVKWGFQPEDVGLVTGNRRENPDARVLVVVAEFLVVCTGMSPFAGGVGCPHKWGLAFLPRRRFQPLVPQSYGYSTASPIPERASSGSFRWRCCGARPHAAAVGTVGNRHRVPTLAAAEPQPATGTRDRQRAPRAAEVPLGGRHAADRAA
jgi:hypothetical protein